MEFTPAQEAEIERRLQEAIAIRMASPNVQIRLEPPTPSAETAGPSGVQSVARIAHIGIEPPIQVAPKTNSVDIKSYKTTATDVSTGVATWKISTSTTDTKKRVKIFNDYLKSAGLYTLIKGIRTVPTCSEDNPCGYVPRRMLVFNDVSTIQNHDDAYHWAHDSQRAFMLCMLFFDTTLHYHCTNEILECNGVKMYAKIMTVVDGTYLRDIERARKALYETFKVNPSIAIAIELDRLQTIMCDFEYAQETVLTEKQKMDLLASHMYKDPRQIIMSAYLTAKSLKMTYEEAKQEIIMTCNDLPPGVATIKMANMSVNTQGKEQQTQYCFGFAQGSCRFGDKCRFKHAIDPAAKDVPGKKEFLKKDKKPDDREKKKGTARDYSNVQLNAAHHKAVGPPRGKPGPANKRGYSSRQREQINMIMATIPGTVQDTNPPPAAFTSWGSPDMLAYMKTDGNESAGIYINSLRVTKDTKSPDIPENDGEEEENEEPESELKTAGLCMTPISKKRKLPLHSPYASRPSDSETGTSAIDRLISSNMELNMKVAQQYQDNGGSVSDFLIWGSHEKLTQDLDKKDKKPILTILGWIQYAPYLEELSNTPTLLSYSAYPLMHLLYSIGRTYLRAEITHPEKIKGYQVRHGAYNTFNPWDELGYDGIRGEYISTHECITDYHTDLLFLQDALELTHPTRMMIKVAIMLDFMAYASSHLRTLMDENGLTCTQARRNFQLEFLNDIQDFDEDDIYICFEAIIRAVKIPDSESPTSSGQPSVLQYEDQSMDQPSVEEYEDRSTTQPSVAEYEEQSTTPPCSQLYVFTVDTSDVRMNAMRTKSVIYDTGATKSGTNDRETLKNIKGCAGLSVHGPFGASISPTEEGLITDLGIPCLHIPQLDGTLLSVSDICKKNVVFVFTHEGCRAFEGTSVHEALRVMDSSGVEVLRGIQENGLYVQTQVPERSQDIEERMFYKNAVPSSLYDQVHHALGHPGAEGMAWHKRNTPGAHYTEDDASRTRPLCKGCVEGGMRQTPTDHRRVHRPRPQQPGQQFSCDAFTCTTTSARGFNYCDFFTDLCTRIVYPVFTKTRSAAELCQMISLLFNAHPSWKPNGGDSSRLIVIENDTPPTPVAGDRFIRVDAATNYRSTEFQEIAHHFGYRLEHTPPRDKHAGGVAERTVGLITLKANVAMLAPTQPVPISFWDSAVSYACQTQSFSLSSVLGTSPYHFLTKEHVNLKHLQPFWTPCYVHIPTKNGWAKSGYPVLIRPASLATITLI